MHKKFMMFLAAALTIAFVRTASAQPVPDLDAGANPPAACEDDPACKATLQQCREDLEQSKKSAAAFERERDECRGKLAAAQPKPPPPKPIEIQCVGPSAKKVGNDCICESDRYVAVVSKTFREKTCVPKEDLYDKVHQLEMWYESLRVSDQKLWEEIQKLYGLLGDKQKFEAEFTRITGEINALKARMDAAEKKLQELEDAVCPGDKSKPLAERCGQKSSWSTAAKAKIRGVYRGDAGMGAILSLNVVQTWWFTSTSRVALELELGAGRYFNEPTGPSTTLEAATGVRFALTEDRMHSLRLMGRGMQFISDHGAGYQGTISQGRGFWVGPEIGYQLDVLDHLNVNCDVGIGYGQINYNVGPGQLAQQDGWQPMFGCGIGGHVKY